MFTPQRFDERGALLGTALFAADRAGCRDLIDWSTDYGTPLRFGIGAPAPTLGVVWRPPCAGAVTTWWKWPAQSRRSSPPRQMRCLRRRKRRPCGVGKARPGDPQADEGIVEMIRHLKIAKDAAVKARSAAMQSIKAMLITAPAELREALEPLPIWPCCAGARPCARAES